MTVARVQGFPPKVPVLSLEKVTEPAGVVLVPVSVSVTVAVQMVAAPTGTEAGVQLTAVVVERVVTVSPKVPGPLPAWVLSPL